MSLWDVPVGRLRADDGSADDEVDGVHVALAPLRGAHLTVVTTAARTLGTRRMATFNRRGTSPHMRPRQSEPWTARLRASSAASSMTSQSAAS